MMRDLFHNCVVGMLMGAFVRKKKIKIKGSPPPLFKETFFLSCFEPCMLWQEGFKSAFRRDHIPKVKMAEEHMLQVGRMLVFTGIMLLSLWRRSRPLWRKKNKKKQWFVWLVLWIYAVLRLYTRENKADSEISDLLGDLTHLSSRADRPVFMDGLGCPSEEVHLGVRHLWHYKYPHLLIFITFTWGTPP